MKGIAVAWCVVALTTSATTTVTQSFHTDGNVSVLDDVRVDRYETCLSECLLPFDSECNRMVSAINEFSLYPSHFDMLLPSGRRFLLQTSIINCTFVNSTAHPRDVYDKYNCDFSMAGYDHILKLSVMVNSDSNPDYASQSTNPMEGQMKQVLHYTNLSAMRDFITSSTLLYGIYSDSRPSWVRLYVFKYACCDNCIMAA